MNRHKVNFILLLLILAGTLASCNSASKAGSKTNSITTTSLQQPGNRTTNPALHPVYPGSPSVSPVKNLYLIY